MSELTRITHRLADFDVGFVVVGGMATILQGSALMTRDVDVACDMSPANLRRVWQALAELHPVHRMTPDRLPFTREQAGAGGFKNLYLATDLGQLDLLGEVSGVGGYEDCFKNSEPIPIGGAEIRVLTLDALIRSKRAMGRPRDLHAVLELEVIRERRNGRI
jgi:hypothetical protein